MSSELATPNASAEYEAAVRKDLAQITSAIEGVVVLLSGLDDYLRLLPRTRQSCAGWRKHLTEIAEQMNAEQSDVTEAVTGARAPTIESVLDVAHLEVVRAAKGAGEEAA